MITLSPIVTKRHSKYTGTNEYVENVAVISDGFPWAIAHIDTFSAPDTKDIYDRLYNKETVVVSLVIEKRKPSEQDKKEAERVNLAILAGMPSN